MTRRILAATLLVGFLAGCDAVDRATSRLRDEPATVPDAETARSYFRELRHIMELSVDGNVIEMRVQQPVRQILRGGALWARVGPYVYILSPGVQKLFEEHGGVAGVRVTTVLPDGEEVARALLRRDALSEINWRRAHNLLGRALQADPGQARRLEELRIWGEEHTQYWYNPEYVN